jgi:hypothetical protein
MNYSELRKNIADFLNRDDLAGQIPMFIELAEARIRRDLRDRQEQVRAEAMVYGEFMRLPCDWLETKTIICDDQILRLMDGFNIERINLTGATRFYRHVEDQIQFIPAPSNKVGARVVLEYLAEVPSLTDSVADAWEEADTPWDAADEGWEADTNWLLQRYPDVYLYGALLSATSYLQDDGRIPVWAQAYGEAVKSANMVSDKADYSGSALRLQRHGVC